MKDILRPILSKGEEYAEIADRKRTGPRTDKRPTYENISEKLINDIEKIKNNVSSMSSEYMLEDIVINVKMRKDRSAKSDHPSAFIKKSNLRQLGTKKWTQKVKDKNDKEKIDIGKDIFLMTDKKNIEYLENLLSIGEEGHSVGFVEDVRSIDEIYFDDHSKLINSFREDWTYGRIEIVLHPFGNKEEEVLNRLRHLVESNGGDTSLLKVRSYSPGPTFVSLFISREGLKNIIPFNPIRSAHPLEMREFGNELTESSLKSLPKLPDEAFKSSIKLGIFDGGVNASVPLLQRYVTENNPIPTEKETECIMHGTAVISAALFDNLKGYDANDNLPVPSVSIESFRVLPLSDPKDYDLYEVIDIIEEIVPTRKDIKVYNLSLGPTGPILDDCISRFTYVLDKLSRNGDRCFVVAVGNDGEMKDSDLRRIQSPADSVNNIAVGSCIIENEEIVKAPYSCIGDGREGSKVKPDVVEFGGSYENPMHFIGMDGKYKVFGSGTSFSSPIVARKMAEILGISNISGPLTARALLIHTAYHPNRKHDKCLGYGVVADNVEKILSCDKNIVTVLYESSILPSAQAKLNIPVVEGLNFKGKVNISWTIAISTEIQSQDTEDYTKTCIEDTFYPNKNKYIMTHPITNKKKTVHKINDSKLIKELDELGWNIKRTPKSHSKSDNSYKTEQERKNNFKWDTVIKRDSGNMRYKEIQEPYIVIHGLERGQPVSGDRIYYSVAITIKYINCQEDVYSKTLKAYNKLQQTQVKTLNEILVK